MRFPFSMSAKSPMHSSSDPGTCRSIRHLPKGEADAEASQAAENLLRPAFLAVQGARRWLCEARDRSIFPGRRRPWFHS
jgi:hypothetical protein